MVRGSKRLFDLNDDWTRIAARAFNQGEEKSGLTVLDQLSFM